MYACLHLTSQLAASRLLELALQFSPVVEETAEETVVFSIDALRKLIGSPHQIASEISRMGYEFKLQANLAMASNPDSAILLARNFPGVILVTPGEEGLKLGPIPLPNLFAHARADTALLTVLHRWGVKTCQELAVLPERGVAERLGKAGVYLRSLAGGLIDRPLQVRAPATSYEERLELEHPLALMEPLLFLLGRTLSELCGRLRSQSRAARMLAVEFVQEEHKPYRCELEFPVPLDDSRTVLKLLQLHLERHPPESPVTGFTVRVDPVEPRRVQNGIFRPPTPPPDKLQVTLARIAAMVGKENAGTPLLLNTHRPDAFQMTMLPEGESKENQSMLEAEQGMKLETLRLVVRLFRPALPARVRLIEYAPKNVIAAGVKGNVIQAAGPWKTSGEWWAATCWSREDWDVALDDGALYRIYQNGQNGAWYVQGVYD